MSREDTSNLEFRGRDLKECEQFISAVNKHARAQGRLRDDQWIADLAAVCIAGDAMLWWSALNEETQGSWRLLQRAMLLRYRLQFAGRSGAETENFVHWVRQRALDVGKHNDPHWPAELASGCFVGSALRWYTSLDLGVRGDWDSLQQAIFVQYGQNIQDDPLPSTLPTPASAAAAPILPRRRVRGRVQVKREDDDCGIYCLSKVLCTDLRFPGRVMVTNRDVEALEVEYEALDPFDDPVTLFIPDNQLPGCDALGMKWSLADPEATFNGLSLCGVDISSGTGSPGPMFAGALLLKPWKVSRSASGQGAMSLRVINKSGGRLLPLSSETVEEYIWFRATKPAQEIHVELFFEPV